jgi:hypothetical protein
MASLLNDILEFSKLHADYIIESSRKSILERYSWSEILINVGIPVLLLFIFIFILKKRYVDKQIKIKITERFKKDLKRNSKKYKD